MRAYSWIALSAVAFACGGSAFTAEPTDTGGDGGAGDDNSAAGVLNRAGRGSGGSAIGTGGKIAKGGSSSGGSTSSGGGISVGGDLGTGGDLVVGGSVAVAGRPSTGGTAGTAGMAGMGGTSPNPIDRVCPKVLPAPGGACMTGLLCSYGADVRTDCRNTSKCSGGVWSINKPACEPLHGCNGVIVGNSCDASAAKPCMLDATEGIYCVCSPCGNAGGACSDKPVWACAGGSGGAVCPKLAPNEGQSCAADQKCGYGSCATSNPLTTVCDGQTWSWNGLVPCPL